MKTKSSLHYILALSGSSLLAITTSHGESILLGGFDGNQTQTAVGSTSQTLVSGVRQLTGALQDTGAIGKVSTRIWTDQTTNKEFQWNLTTIGSTDGTWGATTFTQAASTSAKWVITQAAASWINFEIKNDSTTENLNLDKFHIDYRRANISAAPTGAPDTLTISLEQNGTFANPPVLSASDLTAFTTKTLDLTAANTSTWYNSEFSFSDMLSDWTLAPLETATFRIANNTGGARVYFDNIAISGSFAAVPEPTSALAGLLLTAGLLRRRRAGVR
jgi:hypothetical protein